MRYKEIVVFGSTRGLNEPPPRRRDRAYLLVLWLLLLGGLFVAIMRPSPAAAWRMEADEIAAIAAEYWPEWAVPSVVRVAWCESNWDTGATSAGWDRIWGRYHYASLMQVSVDLHQWRANRLFGYGASLYDPRVNLAVAASLWEERGWAPWPFCARYA